MYTTYFLIFSLFFHFSACLAALPVSQTDQDVIHLQNRLGFGPSEGDVASIQTQGIHTYLQQQLQPKGNAFEKELKGLKSLHMSCEQLYQTYHKQEGQEEKGISPQTPVLEASEARLLRAIYSPEQLYETMVDFWYNHFNVSSEKGFCRFWVGAYERDAIRPYVLGNFYDLLLATAKHPAMLFYLDNWQNEAPSKKNKNRGLNENYAREVMELHTLGVEGGYTQKDVIALARILTGWTFNLRPRPNIPPYTFYFNDSAHDKSEKVFLGQKFEGHGIHEGERALKMLANHPSTAKFISFKLAQYFTLDVPNHELTTLMAKRFSETNGNIKEVLLALFESDYFWDKKIYQKKYKTPYQYAISTIRATGAQVENYKPLIRNIGQMGMPIYGHATPEGYKNTMDAWLSPEGMIDRIFFATALGSGSMPLMTNPKERTKISAESIQTILPSLFTENTLQVVEKAPKKVQVELLLGSPEFMRR